ncbi:MAG TPA: SDR family oxidoreductase [Miltoncostaeaceae bacterium]|nr:SDR family oxidoreductase [Miltoncostaeaceae bacterium]
MRVLITGHNGYIGSVMVPRFVTAGHEVVGLDTDFFAPCVMGPEPPSVESLRMDVRDVTATDLAGFDAVVHLAAISNDPVGNLDPDLTYEINHRASVRLAEAAREAGVARFLYSSSCSLYGAAGDDFLDETADFNPVTPYGRSKVMAEQGIAVLANDDFTPVFLRNATAYGFSPRLRADLVVNDIVGSALTTGEVMLQSDGTPWRPLVHIEDISLAFLCALHAPRQLVHNRAFNVGSTAENYRISEVAEIVEDVVRGSHIAFAPNAGPDKRCYRASCDLIVRALPGFKPQWTVRRGVEQLADAYRRNGLTLDELRGDRFVRLRRIDALMNAGRIDAALRWADRGAARPAA